MSEVVPDDPVRVSGEPRFEVAVSGGVSGRLITFTVPRVSGDGAGNACCVRADLDLLKGDM